MWFGILVGAASWKDGSLAVSASRRWFVCSSLTVPANQE